MVNVNSDWIRIMPLSRKNSIEEGVLPAASQTETDSQSIMAHEATKTLYQFASGFICPGSLIQLSQTSRAFSLFSGNQSAISKLGGASNLLRQLLSHAALGEWVKAGAIYTRHPDLLFCRGTVYHPNRSYRNANDEELPTPIDIPVDHNPGRYKYVNMTAFQIACANEEWAVAKQMADLMPKDAVQDQLEDIFPKGEVTCPHWELEEAKRLLNSVFAALHLDEHIDPHDLSQISVLTSEALHAFYDYVKPKPDHHTGLVCDANLYQEALRLMDDQWASFNDWKPVMFWYIRVEEWLAAALPTAHLRYHSQGSLTETSLRRGCTLTNNSSYFAFRRPRDSVPGYNLQVSHSGRDLPVELFATIGVIPGGFGRSRDYERKNNALSEERTKFMRAFYEEQAVVTPALTHIKR